MSTNLSNYFLSSPAIKIRFPSHQTRGYWAIEEQTQKTTYAVPLLATLMAIYCAQPIRKGDLFNFLTSKITTNDEVLEKTLSNLLQRKIIFSANHEDGTLKNIQQWKSAGWVDAADYHFYTWDAPFLDYTKEGKGHDIDRKKMADFQKKQPDTFRYKTYTQKRSEIPLPFVGAISNNGIKQLSTIDRVKYLLACVFGKIGEKPCHWTDIPLIRRTSPSGGCRHPSEGYFLPSNYLNMENGFYHIQTEPPALCLFSMQSDKTSQIEELKGEDNPDFLGTIFISTVFERNMYRYREPRTFRTVHMDVGHLLASIEILCSELGFKATSNLRFNEKSILNTIRASELEESVLALVTLKKDG